MTITVCEQFYKKFNLQKGSKTENMKAKFFFFYITEDHGTKKMVQNVVFFFVSAES